MPVARGRAYALAMSRHLAWSLERPARESARPWTGAAVDRIAGAAAGRSAGRSADSLWHAGSTRHRWLPLPPLVNDVLLTALVTAAALFGSYGESYPNQPEYAAPLGNPIPHVPLVEFGLVLVAGLVLLWRRAFPVAVWGVSLAAVLAYTALGRVDGASAICPMVALYAVIVARRKVADALAFGFVTAATIFVIGGLFGPFGWADGGQDVIPFVIAAVVFLGLTVASRRSLFAETAERAEVAELTREAEARRRVDAERVRIARELHDVVAHTMAVINVQASAALHSLDVHPDRAREGLQAIRSASKEGLTELRAVLDVLRQVDAAPDSDAPRAPVGGLAHLGTLVAQNAAAGLHTAVTVRGEPRSLPPVVDLAAYRIVQESLTNAVRHSGSAEAEVTLTFGAGIVDIDVPDAGTTSYPEAPRGDDGASPKAVPRPGYGLDGMKERAAALGGTVESGPTATGGFRVHAVLPTDAPLGGAG